MLIREWDGRYFFNYSDCVLSLEQWIFREKEMYDRMKDKVNSRKSKGAN